MTTPNVPAERLKILPLWAQDLIAGLRDELHRTNQTLHRMEVAHGILNTRDWFSVPGPPDEDEKPRRLWLLDRDNPFPIATLNPGDVFLVGRAKHPAKAISASENPSP